MIAPFLFVKPNNDSTSLEEIAIEPVPYMPWLLPSVGPFSSEAQHLLHALQVPWQLIQLQMIPHI